MKFWTSLKARAQEARASVLGWLQDHPRIINVALLGLTVGSVWAIARWRACFFAEFSERGADLALGMLSVAGIMAGFVGVVVVFALQGTGAVFVKLRIGAADHFRTNWVHLISTAFVSAGLSMASAVAYVLGALPVGFGLLLLGTLLSVHAAARLVWLFRVLIDAVHKDDVKDHEAPKKQSARDRYTPAP